LNELDESGFPKRQAYNEIPSWVDCRLTYKGQKGKSWSDRSSNY